MKRAYIITSWGLLVAVVFIGVVIYAKKHQEKHYDYDYLRPKSCFSKCKANYPECSDIKDQKCRDLFVKCFRKCKNIAQKPRKKVHITPKKHHKKDKVVGPRAYFRFTVYPKLLREECGKCENLCHYDPKDRGGLTCGGVAINHNQKWFVDNMNMLHKCKVKFNSTLECPKGTLKQKAFELYYNKYGKKFEKCPRKAFDLLVDSAVLSGVSTATRLLQKSAGIKADGKFGPKTLKACQRFNPQVFTNERIKRFKSLKQCSRYCKGWIKRAKRVLNKSL